MSLSKNIGVKLNKSPSSSHSFVLIPSQVLEKSEMILPEMTIFMHLKQYGGGLCFCFSLEVQLRI